jgi:hypothetical protein
MIARKYLYPLRSVDCTIAYLSWRMTASSRERSVLRIVQHIPGSRRLFPTGPLLLTVPRTLYLLYSTTVLYKSVLYSVHTVHILQFPCNHPFGCVVK